MYGVDLLLRRNAAVSDFRRHERNVKAGLNTLLSERPVPFSLMDPAFSKTPTPFGYSWRQAMMKSRYMGKNILIATGSAPVRPAVLPFGTPGVYDSDSILR